MTGFWDATDLRRDFYQPITGVELPASLLLELELGYSFDKQIAVVVWPSSLTGARLGWCLKRLDVF